MYLRIENMGHLSKVFSCRQWCEQDGKYHEQNQDIEPQDQNQED